MDVRSTPGQQDAVDPCEECVYVDCIGERGDRQGNTAETNRDSAQIGITRTMPLVAFEILRVGGHRDRGGVRVTAGICSLCFSRGA